MTATRAAVPTPAALPSDKRATAPAARHDTARTNVPTSAPAVMHKGACACGGGCPRCANKVPLQAKLRVSQPHDPLEQEADQVAEQIMRMSAATGAGENNSPSVTSAGGMAAGGMEVNSQMTDALASRRSYGVPLSSDARGFFEPRFGSSLGSVRIHDDVPAQEMAESVNARAFTLGQDIYYAAGQFDTVSTGGLRLLAHELTHTVQQGNHIGVLQREGEEDEETAEEDYDPRREILSLSAFARRYPEIMRRYNDLEQQMDELDQDVAAYGPVGFEFSELQVRYARARERWSAATAVLDEYWCIARVMVAAARATQVLVVVNDMRRAQLAAGRSGFGGIEFSPLTTPHQRTLRVRNLLNTALAERPETARVHEAVGEEIERESTARERESAPALRSVAETVGDLRAYVLANFHGISAGDGRLRYAMGIANLLHVNLGDTAASYVELFSRLESENLEFYTLILFRGATIGYLQDMGVAGLAEHVYRDAARAGAHMLLGAWDFDEATGEERDSPTWTLLLDILVGIIPFGGQVADVRDITGYIYRIGKYPAQQTNPWTWVGAVGTLIGLIPVVGDAAKSLLSAVRRTVTEVVGRLSDAIIAAATRHVDGATLARFLDATDDLGRSLTVRWIVIQGDALNYWDRILAELGSVLVRVSDLTQAELNLVRRAAAEHLPEGFRLAGAWLGQLVQSLWVTARLTARHEAEDIIAMIREFRETWTLASEAVQQLWSPTARFLANLEPAERAAVRANLLELAARESDEIAQVVRRMLGEESETARVADDVGSPAVAHTAADAERRAVADAPETLRAPEPARETGAASHVSDDLLRRERETLESLAGQPGALVPVDDPNLILRGYETEIDIGGGVTYRRRADGTWCRFNSPPTCGVPVPSALEDNANALSDVTEAVASAPHVEATPPQHRPERSLLRPETWDRGRTHRGLMVEHVVIAQRLGSDAVELPARFRAYDAVVGGAQTTRTETIGGVITEITEIGGGTAYSVKSADLREAGYQTASGVVSNLRRYVTAIINFPEEGYQLTETFGDRLFRVSLRDPIARVMHVEPNQLPNPQQLDGFRRLGGLCDENGILLQVFGPEGRIEL